MAPVNSLIVIILLSSVLLLVAAACVILFHKFKHYRSRPYLLACCSFLFQFFGMSGTILRTLLNGQDIDPFGTILRPASLITGLLTLLFILAYIVEIKHPGKVSLKKMLVFISPAVVLTILLLLIHPVPLYSFEELSDGIRRPDVLIRLMIVFLYFAYPIAAACLSYEWRQCLVSKKTIVLLHILTCLISPAFLAGLVCGYFPAIILDYIIAVTIDVIVAYIELKVRIPVTEPVRSYESVQEQEHSTPKQQTSTIFLDSPEIWMNPDITAAGLAQMMGTNRTYLLEKIKGLGYQNFSDMINRKRVGHICKRLKEEKDVNIIDLMFEAGYRSRATASREFKLIVGCTPSEYREHVSQAN